LEHPRDFEKIPRESDALRRNTINGGKSLAISLASSIDCGTKFTRQTTRTAAKNVGECRKLVYFVEFLAQFALLSPSEPQGFPGNSDFPDFAAEVVVVAGNTAGDCDVNATSPTVFLAVFRSKLFSGAGVWISG